MSVLLRRVRGSWRGLVCCDAGTRSLRRVHRYPLPLLTRSLSQVRKDTISDDLAQLRQGISVLEAQLREQVVSHHGRLIEQVLFFTL